MTLCPRLCAACPMAPQGVTATVVAVSKLTSDEQRRLAMGLGPEARASAERQLRLKIEASETTNPQVEQGDVSYILVNSDGKTADELKEGVRTCTGPVYTRLQRFFRFLWFIIPPHGYCGSLKRTENFSQQFNA